jgi:hypothetical protein
MGTNWGMDEREREKHHPPGQALRFSRAQHGTNSGKPTPGRAASAAPAKPRVQMKSVTKGLNDEEKQDLNDKEQRLQLKKKKGLN